MSVKLSKRLSSKKIKLPKDNVQGEILQKLGLEAYISAPLDSVSMLDISTWTLEDKAPLQLKDLPLAFLQRLWLLRQDARSPCCHPQHDIPKDDNKSPEEKINGVEDKTQCAINSLDLVTSVFISANTFLQQEIMVHMMQCQFAVPLVLPNIDPEEPSRFLLWPLRGVLGQWRSHSQDQNRRVQEGNLASTSMPIVSCIKLGRCGVSKSRVLNYVLNGPQSHSETFVHRGMDGGELPRRLSNGLVELGWYLPTGEINRDIFPFPMIISNLRGDSSTHEKSLKLLCQASSAVIVFCGDLREKEKHLLLSCKDIASMLILIDLSDKERKESSVVGFVEQNLKECIGLPEGSVLSGSTLSEEEVANKLGEILKGLLPDQLKSVTLEAAAKLALEIGLSVDEGPECKKAMSKVEEVLKGLGEGPAKFQMNQLPLQGPLWSKLAEIDKEESKQKKEGQEVDPQLQKEKKDILAQLSSYKMTPAMKSFTDALFTTDKIERTYFLTWLKMRLHQMQTKTQNSLQESITMLQTEEENAPNEHFDTPENGVRDSITDSDSFCTDSSIEEEAQQFSINGEFQDSGQHCEAVEEFILQSSNNTTELNNDDKAEPLESRHDPVTEEESHVASTEKEAEGAEMSEKGVCLEEQVSHQISKDQSSQLDSEESGTLNEEKRLDQPELTCVRPDSVPPAKPQTCREALFEDQVASKSQFPELHPDSLGLEHFMREMGLIFELTHVSPGSGNQNVLGLPSLATDLLLYGVPLELMDGNASNIPMCWLGCVFAELKRRLPQEELRTRVLTNLGVYHARNAEVLSAVFGVKFPERRGGVNKGVHMVALRLPDDLRKELECDFLLLIDVEGLCSVPADNSKNTLTHDNEMATFAAGLSDVLMHNISPFSDEFETIFTVTVNALLRTKERGSLPICQLLIQDEGINSILQASQLRHVSKMLQTATEERGNVDNHYLKTTTCTTCVKGPWSIMSLYEPVDAQYSESVLKLKGNLFGALKMCADKSKSLDLPEFMGRLCAVWDAVKSDSFSIGLQNTEIALAFSLLCTEFSKWEGIFLESIESWLKRASDKIFETKAKALHNSDQSDLLIELKKEAQEEVKLEVKKVISKGEAYLVRDDLHKINVQTFRPILMRNIDNLANRVTEELIQKLDIINESHCSLAQLKNFENLLEEKQESKLLALVQTSKATKILLQDAELEEEFEDVWSKTLSNFDFRPSETDDITSRVRDVLIQNLTSRGLLKHMKKLDSFGQIQTSSFQVADEYFGYRSRLKHMFEDNNKQQRLEAQQVASKMIDEYNQFVKDKSSLTADFSDSYIVELLEKIEKAVKEKSMEIRTAFEVDLKIYLCNAACQDFQKLHNRFAKDRELLACISASKIKYLAQFIYQFRKRDQCQRVAQAFTFLVIKPTVLDYINSRLGLHIVEDIKNQVKQFQSPQAFQKSLLEELINEDCFESFVKYLLSYDDFRVRKIQETVVAHLSESSSLGKWRQQGLGEIIGKIAAAVSQITEGTNGVLSDTKPLLETVCLILKRDADVEVNKALLNGPFFSITTEWHCFVKCLMELLATLRLELVQEFSQDADISQILYCLPVQPQDYLLLRVSGCNKRCPLCRAPCEEEEPDHEIHKALLHRPKGTLPYGSHSPSHTSFPDSMNQGKNNNAQDISVTCKDLNSLHPDWSSFSDDPDSQKGGDYWRYVLVRFNERFAEEFQHEPEKIPQEWKEITQEKALDSLREVFPTKESC
ncbi:interferon-induced very large GTPase 1 [Melanotaenia boesemani]|uniref:interferon-induced very large GTPase 1 n=1 Tax=Melanotaenia boesemani TaxID=1250792 RepID=UPI001C05DA07|nr:interferon-induced very large GTPase 1 [Melanotaenia boesemani]